MSLLKILYLVLKSILLNCLLSLKLKTKNLKMELEMPTKKNNPETKKEGSFQKEKTEFSPLDKRTEKKPKFEELLPKPEGASSESPGGEEESGQITAIELEEVCGNLWVVLYQLGGILKKGFEPLTENEKKLYSPVSARLAVKYHVQDYMKDEFLLLGLFGISISKRLIVKKNDNNNSGEKKNRENNTSEKSHS